MALLEFKKKNRKALTVRLPEEAVAKLIEIADKYEVSQSKVIERLIEVGYAELGKASKARSKKK